MRLSTIEIQGFKSFAEKTVLNFNKDITGVVGPNGCGKSNVVDALRWVLGEQRIKTLRSNKIDNLIFNGTSKKKQANRAHVALTFDNDRGLLPTEFSTVTVARTVYRTGESEYRLNDVKCRLKDIRELFSDTGISSDSYAIIELGMISEILADKDDIRRKLFEQASNISKYKQRKKETLNKLNLTQVDLDRVDDLLAEIENNLKALEKQAKKAERYNKIKEKYKDFSLNLTMFKLKDHKTIFANLKQKQAEQDDNKLALETTVNKLDAFLAESKRLLVAKEQDLAEAQKELNEGVEQLRSEENNKGILSERIRFLREKKETLSNRIQEDEYHITKLKTELEELETSSLEEVKVLGELEGGLQSTKRESDEVRAEYEEQKSKLQNYESQLVEVRTQVHAFEKEQAIARTQVQSLENDVATNKIKSQTREEDLNAVRSKLAVLEASRLTEFARLETVQGERDQLKEKISLAETQIETVKEKLYKTRRQLDVQRNEFSLTKSMVDDLEGSPDSIRYLKENTVWSSNRVLVSDIISAQPEYKGAIELFLEPLLSHYVVHRVEDAYRAVDMLRNDQKGRASFIVLDQLSAAAASESIMGAVPAASVVQVDPTYRKLVDHLFSNTFLVDEDRMGDVSRSNPHATLISKSGKVVNQKGIVRGGASSSMEGKRIGRLEHLETLARQISELEVAEMDVNTELEKAVAELAQLKTQMPEEQMSIVQKALSTIDNDIITCATNIKNFELFLTDHQSQGVDMVSTIENLSVRAKELDGEIRQVKKQEGELESQVEIVRRRFDEIEKKQQTSAALYNEKNIAFHKQESIISTSQQNIFHKQNRSVELEQQVKEQHESLASCTTELESIENQIKNSDSGLKDLYNVKEDLEKNVAAKEEAYYKYRGEIDEKDKEMREVQKNKEQIDFVINELKDKFNTLQMDMLSVKERMSIEFNVDINELLEGEPTVDMPFEELEEKVEKLKNRIANFGEVNPFAVEAYNEMQDRVNFINGQKEDLLQAKDSLMQTIKEIEATATMKFMDAFNRTRENFKYIFTKLFNEGDTCDLRLSDPDNPLDSKVEIMARPKGKRPLTIDQLSGGEKALTAISLIFSLYLLKPAPFCVLDEVDAPLDDINVEKFNNIIREFSAKSQFILVTHNKATMATADNIYGIVMAQTGISKAVPVDFSSLN